MSCLSSSQNTLGSRSWCSEKNGSPWRLVCLCGHAQHPKNTAQDSGVSLVTTGRKCRPTSSSRHFLSRFLLSFSFRSSYNRNRRSRSGSFFCLGKDERPAAGIPDYGHVAFPRQVCNTHSERNDWLLSQWDSKLLRSSTSDETKLPPRRAAAYLVHVHPIRCQSCFSLELYHWNSCQLTLGKN